MGSRGSGASLGKCMTQRGLPAIGGGASDPRQGLGPSSAPPISRTPL